ncbi:hypothetical protein ABMA28_000206 [Loxostege sticticalis]|uniref:Uncharacterized protein n=1 Tax=Loxostege sticticalis TaxID=481309 RepID=A0ABD0TRE8_LOXSC
MLPALVSRRSRAQTSPSAVSLDELVQCPHCQSSKLFKGRRGLNIHIGRCHKLFNNHPFPSSLPATSHSVPLSSVISALKNSIPIVKRIPRGARYTDATSLSKTIDRCVSENSRSSWESLLSFSYNVLHVDKNDSNHSLTSQIKSNCSRPSITSIIESKVNDGDLKGAARILFFSDTAAPNSLDTLASAGVLDGITPQNLKDLVMSAPSGLHAGLLTSITRLVNLMLGGKVNSEATATLYGANLCALAKKDGSVKPIAIGTTFRRLASKICCKHILPSLFNHFS